MVRALYLIARWLGGDLDRMNGIVPNYLKKDPQILWSVPLKRARPQAWFFLLTPSHSTPQWDFRVHHEITFRAWIRGECLNAWNGR